MNRNMKTSRIISMLLILAMAIGFVPALAFEDEYKEGDVLKFEQRYDALKLYDPTSPDYYKYFKMAEATGLPLAEGHIGTGEARQHNPYVPHGQFIEFEFLMEQTQRVRLELLDAEGRYLGLIACDLAYGQWGDLADGILQDGDTPDGARWYDYAEPDPALRGEPVGVSNHMLWDGSYWDSEISPNVGGFVLPGADAGGAVAPGVYEFLVRFQPTHPSTEQYTVDVPLTIRYTDEAISEIMPLRDESTSEGKENDPVNMINGNLMWDYTDIAVHGASALEFGRHYNALGKAETELGFGWRHAFLYELELTRLFATVTTPTGTKASFSIRGDGSFTAPEGEARTLEWRGGGYLFTDNAKTEYLFDSDGRLASITYADGDATTVTRSGAEIATVSNRSGTLTFGYSGGRISTITDQTGRGVSYSYDANGDLATYTNADGDTIGYEYQGHLLTKITDFDGNAYLTNAYDGIGRVTSQTLAGQGTSYFEYDYANRESKITDPEGAVRTYRYDVDYNLTYKGDTGGQVEFAYENGRIASRTDRLGNSTSYTHDSSGNTASITYPDGLTELFEYNSLNLVTKATARDGSEKLYGYDARGNMTSYTDALGRTSLFTYDLDNNLLTSEDPLGNVTTYTYDAKGNVLSTTDPLGNTMGFAYDSQGRLISQTNADGGTATFEYTDAGKLVKAIAPDGSEQEYAVTGNGYGGGATDPMGNSTSTLYNEQNKPVAVTDAMGNTATYSYDGAGRLSSTADALGNTTSYGYDLAGRMTSMTDARGNAWHYSYDAEGRMTSTTDPYGNATTAAFDAIGRTASRTDARGAQTAYEYDAMGRTTRTTDAYGSYGQSAYDAAGNLVAQRDKNGNEWEYSYDDNNRLIEAKDPLGYITTYEYDANGRGTKTVSALGARPQSVYDNMGRLATSVDAEGNETSYTYDILGRLIRADYADGTHTANEYNANGWLVRATARDGGETAYAYNANGQVLTITDAMGGTASYSYDALGRTSSFTDPAGGTTAYSYDANSNIASVTDALGGITAYDYDALNRVVTITDPMGGVTATEYDANGNVSKITNPDGGYVAYAYDLLNRLAAYTDAEGNSWSFAYDANGNALSSTDGNGNTAYTAYDALNRAAQSTDAAGGISTVEYDADGRVTKTTTPKGAETMYWYDLNGNIVKATDALGNPTLFEYDGMGRVVKMTDAKGAETSYAYTAAGKVASVTDALGGTVHYAYDLLGRLISETDQMGETTSYAYDALGRVASVTDPLGNADLFTYDALGRIKTVTDKNGNVTRYNYDANGNIMETVDALGNSALFEYDAMGRLVKTTLHRVDAPHGVDEQQITLYQYDHRGLVTKEIDALGFETAYAYDGNGNMTQKTDADGYVTEYSYDARNLVEAINYSGAKGVSFQYDADGNLVAMEDWNGTLSFGLDLLGRITSANDQNNKAVSYTYDAVGNQTGMKYPDNTTVTYSYDALGRLLSVKDAESQTTSYSYDAASRPVSMSYPNGWTETYEYDAAGRLVAQRTEDPSGQPNKAVERAYSYDPQGNVTTESRTGAHGMASYSLEHTYDALNRLASTTGGPDYKDRTYTYDSLGNLIKEQAQNKATEYWHDALNRQVQKKSGNSTYSYTYDNRGNLILEERSRNNQSAITAQYVYDETDRMIKGTNADGEESHYVYNGLGYLIANEMAISQNAYGYAGVPSAPTALNPNPGQQTQVVRKDYVLDYASPLKSVIMETEAGGLTYRYTYGLGKLGVAITGVSNGAGSIMQYAYDDEAGEFVLTDTEPGGNVLSYGVVKLWTHASRLGTIDFATDNVQGNVISYATYDDWGAPTSKAVLKTGLRELDVASQYTVHTYDQVLGLYFAQARMYDAAGRRFLAMDPADGWIAETQSLNRYSYALCNPAMWVDPMGLLAIKYGDYSIGYSIDTTSGALLLDLISAEKALTRYDALFALKTTMSSVDRKSYILSYGLSKTYANISLSGTNVSASPVTTYDYQSVTYLQTLSSLNYGNYTNPFVTYEYFVKLVCTVSEWKLQEPKIFFDDVNDAFKYLAMYLNGTLSDGVLVDEAVKYVAEHGEQTTVASSPEYVNDTKFDIEILAWTNFWNNRVTNGAYSYNTTIRADIVKAQIAFESSLGTNAKKNGINDVMQSLIPGDYSLWYAAAIDPTVGGRYHRLESGTRIIDTINADGSFSFWEVRAAFEFNDVNREAPFGEYGIRLVDSIIGFGGGESKKELLYDQRNVTSRMSISVGVGFLVWNVNYRGKGSEYSGIVGYGSSPDYAIWINAELKKMNSRELLR